MQPWMCGPTYYGCCNKGRGKISLTSVVELRHEAHYYSHATHTHVNHIIGYNSCLDVDCQNAMNHVTFHS